MKSALGSYHACAMSDPGIVHVNGAPQPLGDGEGVLVLLRRLELEPAQVALELNGTLLPRTLWDEARLAPGDRLEIVTLVGGG